jgi:hypothetical protein
MEANKASACSLRKRSTGSLTVLVLPSLVGLGGLTLYSGLQVGSEKPDSVRLSTDGTKHILTKFDGLGILTVSFCLCLATAEGETHITTILVIEHRWSNSRSRGASPS